MIFFVSQLEKNIFPHLEFNDLLRVRRVSKQLKTFTDGYVWRDAFRVGEMEISEEPGMDFAALLASGIVPSKLFIKNLTGYEFFEKIDNQVLTNFIQNVAPHVTKLRVLELSIFPSPKEWNFLASLVNLEDFEAAYYGIGGADNSKNISRIVNGIPNSTGSMLPGEWTVGLRRLKIGRNPYYRFIFDMMQRYVAILRQFVNLREVCIPYLSFDPDGDTGFVPPTGQIVAQHTFNLTQ